MICTISSPRRICFVSSASTLHSIFFRYLIGRESVEGVILSSKECRGHKYEGMIENCGTEFACVQVIDLETTARLLAACGFFLFGLVVLCLNR